MLRIIKVTGTSLSPLFLPGDFVIIASKSWLAREYRPGDALVFNHAKYGLLVKVLQELLPGDNAYWVTSIQPDGLDSRILGPIPDQDVLGRVIWQVKKPRNPAA